MSPRARTYRRGLEGGRASWGCDGAGARQAASEPFLILAERGFKGISAVPRNALNFPPTSRDIPARSFLRPLDRPPVSHFRACPPSASRLAAWSLIFQRDESKIDPGLNETDRHGGTYCFARVFHLFWDCDELSDGFSLVLRRAIVCGGTWRLSDRCRCLWNRCNL